MAYYIRILFVKQTFNNVRTCVVSKSLTSWFKQAIKHRAELIFNKLRHISSMIYHIILHNSSNNSTECTLIVKTIIRFYLNEISIGAFQCQVVQPRIYFLINLDPIRHMEHVDEFLQHLATIAQWHCFIFRVQNIEFFVQSLCLEQHLHKSGENSTCISCFIVGFDSLDLLIEMFEQMESRNKGYEQTECYYFQQSCHKIDQQLDNNKLSINTEMATQQSIQKIQNNTDQGINLLVQKQELIKQLVQRCNRQEKRLTKLLYEQQSKEQTKVVQFKQYSKYINEFEVNNKRILFICLQMQSQLLDKQQPIIISNFLELQALPDYNTTKQTLPTINNKKDIGIIVNKANESQFQQGLAKNVQVLQQNLNKCQSLLTSLKELNEGDQLKRTPVRQGKSQLLSDKQKQKKQVEELKRSIENLQLEILKYSQTNEKLRQKIHQLEQAQQYYLSVIEELQINRIKYSRGSPTKQLRQMKKQEKIPNKQKKKQGKVYLLNY